MRPLSSDYPCLTNAQKTCSLCSRTQDYACVCAFGQHGLHGPGMPAGVALFGKHTFICAANKALASPRPLSRSYVTSDRPPPLFGITIKRCKRLGQPGSSHSSTVSFHQRARYYRFCCLRALYSRVVGDAQHSASCGLVRLVALTVLWAGGCLRCVAGLGMKCAYFSNSVHLRTKSDRRDDAL